MVTEALLNILGCPACEHRPPLELSADQGWLVCTACQRHYPIRDGIPVLLVDEAVPAKQASAGQSSKI